jgi:hypothetical protein
MPIVAAIAEHGACRLVGTLDAGGGTEDTTLGASVVVVEEDEEDPQAATAPRPTTANIATRSCRADRDRRIRTTRLYGSHRPLPCRP